MNDDTQEWPKKWDDIGYTPERDDIFIDSIHGGFVDFGPLRIYEDTVYINEVGGDVDMESEFWMPLGVYLRGDRDE